MNNETIKHMYVDELDGGLAVKAVTANGNCTTINLEDGTIETKRAKRVVKVEFDVETFHILLQDCIKQCVIAACPYTREVFKCKKCGNTKHAPHTWPKYCPMCGASMQYSPEESINRDDVKETLITINVDSEAVKELVLRDLSSDEQHTTRQPC